VLRSLSRRFVASMSCSSFSLVLSTCSV
jgi:hypothetical protein